MNIKPLNRIVTDFFLVVKRQKGNTFTWEPRLDLLVACLIRASAYKIIIPDSIPRNFPTIAETIKRYPSSLARRIKVVDRNKETYKRVLKYLRPVYEATEKDKLSSIDFGFTVDFLYKMAIASKFRAEADIHRASHIGFIIDKLKSIIKDDDEARVRLDQLYGIYNIYEKPREVDTITLLPKLMQQSIYERIDDLLDEAEIIELSKDRYHLGIPSKAKIAFRKIKKRVGKIAVNEKYSNRINSATDLIQILGSSTGLPVPAKAVHGILREFGSSSYNPPIIDLDYFRHKIARGFDKAMNVILPIGTYGTGIGISEEYFHRMALKYDRNSFQN